MILLDTHAAIWLARAHKRARPLKHLPRLYLSPATLLELQCLVEIGRVRLSAGAGIEQVARHHRWTVDEPPAARWFAAACEVSWTRDRSTGSLPRTRGCAAGRWQPPTS